MNIGYSSRLNYDQQAYQDRLSESVGPINYQVNENYDTNFNQCLSVYGPRSSFMGQGVSTYGNYPVATSQHLVGIESILSNRNVPLSKDKNFGVNPIDVTKFNMNNLQICNRFLDPISSHLSLPPSSSRGLAVNRFYDLHENPQSVIYWNRAANSSLQEKDNFIVKLLQPFPQIVYPNGEQGGNQQNFTIYNDVNGNIQNNKGFNPYCNN